MTLLKYAFDLPVSKATLGLFLSRIIQPGRCAVYAGYNSPLN